MGKYALENYSPYETYKIRPLTLPEAPSNFGRGQYNSVEFTWEELEPERGRYLFSLIGKKLSELHNPILVINQVPPHWLNENPEECFAHLVRRVAGVLTGQKLIGVVISSAYDSEKIWDAYIESFNNVPLLADLKKAALIRYLKEKEQPFGLLVECCESNWMECCELFAQYRLQNTWMQMPVLLQLQGKAAGPHIRRESLRWHAGLADQSMDLGYNITLRRLTYPKKLTENGALPVRFWFANNGSAPCYQGFDLKLRLEQEEFNHEFTLSIDRNAWGLGDIIHNEILSLPQLQEGSYLLSVGVFFVDGCPMKLNLHAEESGGFYKLGTIEVDNQGGKDLSHTWDDFYPDGYYPLEDPQLPN